MTAKAQLAIISQQPYFYQFLTNLINYLQESGSDANAINSLINSFTWIDTPEGDDFWSPLHDSFSHFPRPVFADGLWSLISLYSATYPELFI